MQQYCAVRERRSRTLVGMVILTNKEIVLLQGACVVLCPADTVQYSSGRQGFFTACQLLLFTLESLQYSIA